jgi:glycosyltransferase involved in cell wall biosynthesis
LNLAAAFRRSPGRYFDLRWLPWLSRQLPVILNLRDTWALSGHCAGFQGCERWKTGCGRCPDLDIYPPLERDTTAANWSRKARIYARSRLYVTAPSQWMMDQIAQSMLHAAKSKLISNGIDIETFRPADRDYARRALDLPPDGVIPAQLYSPAHSRLSARFWQPRSACIRPRVAP